MKTNIRRLNYNGKPNPTNGKWWSWDETCDKCGADCGKSGWTTTEKPDTTEKDYCLNCIRQLLDERVKNKK